MTELYRSLAKHFSALCPVPVTVVDTADRRILFTHSESAVFFCDQCPNRCRLLPTMLYGCNEAKRWSGRYIFYCPIGLVFSAVTVPETDHTVLAGPMTTGELQDTLADLPEDVDAQSVAQLFNCTATMLNHVSSILEMAVYGLRYRPKPSDYDKNVITEQSEEDGEGAEQYSSFPFLSEREGELHKAVQEVDEAGTRAVLNQLLRYVYSPHPDQLALIRSRAAALVQLLARTASDGGTDPMEAALYNESYLRAVRSCTALEDLDIALSDILRHFMDYTFDFSQIRHSDTIYHIMEYIRTNYARKIGLEDIAAYVHLSGSHVSSLFSKETGQTISGYLNQVRIERSKPLLLQPDLPIVDIAAQCGFGDQSYFTRVFKKQTGVSPKRFRQLATE